MKDARSIGPFAMLVLALASCATVERPVEGPNTIAGPPPSRPGPGVPLVTSKLAPGAADMEVELRQVSGTGFDVRHVAGRLGEATVPHRIPVGRRLCTLPCSVVVDGSQEFFFTGPGLEDSTPFTLSADSGEVRFTVSPGRKAVDKAGTAIASIGGMCAAFGAVILPLGEAKHNDTTVKAGAALLIPGAVLLGTGIALILTGRTTYVKTTAPLVW